MENGFELDLAGSLARDTTPVAKWMATWRSYVTWPLGSHSQVATGLDNTCQHYAVVV